MYGFQCTVARECVLFTHAHLDIYSQNNMSTQMWSWCATHSSARVACSARAGWAGSPGRKHWAHVTTRMGEKTRFSASLHCTCGVCVQCGCLHAHAHMFAKFSLWATLALQVASYTILYILWSTGRLKCMARIAGKKWVVRSGASACEMGLTIIYACRKAVVDFGFCRRREHRMRSGTRTRRVWSLVFNLA